MEDSRLRFQRIRQRVTEFERTLDALKQELLALERHELAAPPAATDPPSEGQGAGAHRATYERLYADFLGVGPEVVQRFVEANDEEQLTAFCEANRLKLGRTAISKARIAVELARNFAERRGKTKREQ